MTVACLHGEAMDSYGLGPLHPLKPQRVTLSIDLMRDYGLLAEKSAPDDSMRALLVDPAPASDADLELVHSPEYVATVKAAGAGPRDFVPSMGLGTVDNPVVTGLHEVSSAIAGGSVEGLLGVLEGRWDRSFAPAGGLHHAHRSRAAGFCVYNDCAVAMARALAERPELKLMYVDIDAHHGDGVQEAFWDDPRVLTVSLHESGKYLFPGTGFASESGGPGARGFAANVALPPMATDACYRLAFREVIAPLARAFRPDVLVTQNGADAHHEDPLTQLGLTLRGYGWLAGSLRGLADEVCDGRMAAHGGGGYAYVSVVPRAWTLVMASLLGVDLPQELPAVWRERVRRTEAVEAPRRLTDDGFTPLTPEERLLDATRGAIEAVRRAVFSAHGISVG